LNYPKNHWKAPTIAPTTAPTAAPGPVHESNKAPVNVPAPAALPIVARAPNAPYSFIPKLFKNTLPKIF
jgi:hypothetical protein